jgi:hypothetical protein
MRRAWLFVLVLAAAACGSPNGRGPAWPKQHDKDADGGESLAPRPSAASVAAVERTPEPAEKLEAKAALEAGLKGDDDKPAAPKADKPADKTETPIQTEEIIIEINDD